LVVVDPSETGSGAIVANGAADAGIDIAPLGDAGPWQGVALNYPGALASSMSYVTFDSVGGLQEGCAAEGQIPASGGAIQLLTRSGVCQPAPALSNLTFLNLPPGAYGILPWYVTTAGVATLQAANPGAFSVYVCNIMSPGACGN
jgi:hypothetical protein